MKPVEHVKTGKKDVRLTTPSHVGGVQEGNEPKKLTGSAGVRHGKHGRSTGINADNEQPLDPASPKLTPA